MRCEAVGRKIALVPTMGALHDGHRQLMRTARRLPGTVLAASIFVNPLQFGPNEDFDRYPRPLEHDLDVCREERVELVFTPSREDMYPGGPEVTVHPGPLGDELEGAARPGHFAGVLTVVAKLFNIIRPDYAVFGEKDYQQLTLIRKLVRDLNHDVKIIGVPVVAGRRRPRPLVPQRLPGRRPAQRRPSHCPRHWPPARRVSAGGAEVVLESARAVLDKEPLVEVDYLELRGTDLGPAPARGEARLLVAARVGTTRLIDNAQVLLGQGED